jgi:hypothetical protein
MTLRLLLILVLVGCSAGAAFGCNNPPPKHNPPPPSHNPPPSSTTPPSQPAPPPSNGPDHAGYCDAAGKFYDLIAGQDKQPPWDALHLRPADVNPATGAIYCTTPVAAAEASSIAPPESTAVASADTQTHTKTVSIHTTNHANKHTKAKKHRGTVRAAGRHAKLPFTK